MVEIPQNIKDLTNKDFWRAVPEEAKLFLNNVGFWKEFLRIREGLKNEKDENGGNLYSASSARWQAWLDTLALMEGGGEVSAPVMNDDLDTNVDGVDFSKLTILNSDNFKDINWWIYNNIGRTDWKQWDSPVPSFGAIQHLQEIQKKPDTRDKFYQQILPKLIPSRSEQEKVELQEEDGSHILEHINKILDNTESIRKLLEQRAAG